MARSEWERTVALMRMDPGEMGSDPSDAGRLLLRLASAQLQYVGQLRRYLGVTLSELHTLLALWDGGRCSMSTLADRVDLSRAAITTLADRIETAGYVERVPDPSDRRRVLLSVTQKFERAISEHAARLLDDARDIAEGTDGWPTTAAGIARLREALLMDAALLRDHAPRRSRGRAKFDVPEADPSTYW